MGLPLEMSHGSVRVMLVYLFGVVSGSLATSVCDHSVFLAGASGGIYALITGYFKSDWQNISLIKPKCDSWLSLDLKVSQM